MRNFKSKVFKTYNLLFILCFGLARGLPLLVFFLAAHMLTANQYVNLENMFAVSQLVLSFASFGISGLLAVVNQTKNNKDIINRHIQIVSLILFLISTIIYFTNYYLILNVLNILIILLVTHSTTTLLKINKKRIFGLGSECLIYSFILVLFIFFYFNKVKFEYEFLQKNFFYFLSLIYLIIHFFYYGQKIILKISFNEVIRLYKRSYGLFISGIIISFISLYPRVFIKYFPEDQQFDFIYSYRVAFLGFIIHQLFSTFFFRNIYKSRWLKVIKIISITVLLTFLASGFCMLLYVYLAKYEMYNLAFIEFNFYIVFQIFLLSLVNNIQIILLRSKKTILFYNKNIFIFLIIGISSLVLFNYIALDIIYLSLLHIVIMILYVVISYRFLKNEILPKKIS